MEFEWNDPVLSSDCTGTGFNWVADLPTTNHTDQKSKPWSLISTKSYKSFEGCGGNSKNKDNSQSCVKDICFSTCYNYWEVNFWQTSCLIFAQVNCVRKFHKFFSDCLDNFYHILSYVKSSGGNILVVEQTKTVRWWRLTRQKFQEEEFSPRALLTNNNTFLWIRRDWWLMAGGWDTSVCYILIVMILFVLH